MYTSMWYWIDNLYYKFIKSIISHPRQATQIRYISRICSSARRASVSASSSALPVSSYHGRCELDTHADTIVAGKNCVVLHYTGKVCDVEPYRDDYESMKNIAIASVATAWQSPVTGQCYILVLNEALWMGDTLPHTLINPNQLRHFGVYVQDDPTSSRPLSVITADTSFALEMSCSGTIVGFTTRTPTQQELQSCPHIVLSSDQPWNPASVRFQSNSHSLEEEIERVRQVSSMSKVESHALEIEDLEQEENSSNQLLFHLSSITRRIASLRLLICGTNTGNRDKVLNKPKSSIDVSIDVSDMNTFQSSDRHTDVTARDLSERWHISVTQAEKTLQKTTQKFLRSAILPLSRRYRADRMFRRKTLDGKWSTDTLDGRVKSLDGNRYAQVFANKGYFSKIYPMDSKSKAGDALRLFCAEFGIPHDLTFDGSKEQTKKNTTFMKEVRKHGIDYHISEPEMHNQNPVEGVIREIRKKWYRTMVRKRVPKRLWDYGMSWCSEIMSMTHSSAGNFNQSGIPREGVTGETEDISEYLDFGFYDEVWYKDNGGLSPQQPGRWLGVSHRTGRLMCYHILTQKATVVSRSTVQRVTNLEKQTNDVINLFKEFDDAIKEKLKDYDRGYAGAKPDPEDWADMFDEDPDFQDEFNKVFNNSDIPEADDTTPEVGDDTYLNMELALPGSDDGDAKMAKVTKRLRDENGNPIGRAHDNPILDTRVYEIEYIDGTTAALSANAIAENLFAQVDDEGNRYVLFDSIIDHRTDGTEVLDKDAFIKLKHGGRKRRITTKGWEILIQWKDGSTTWESLKDVKNCYPVQLSEYAIQMQLEKKPAFAWWIDHAVRKRNRIVAKLKSKYWTKTHKFGIKVPKTVKEALEIDRENGNTLWWDAICQEMKNVRIAFEEFEGNEDDIPSDFQEIPCHIIFDVKMGENFRRKARMVAGGHVTETPSSITYSSVVSRDSVRLAFTLAALNDLKVLGCDIQNAYLTAKCREKCWTRAGPEFGSEEGKIFIIVRALYGLKSSGAAFRALLCEKLWELGYRPSYADPDVYMRPAVKESGFEYWEYVLCYVDDVLCVSHKPERTMEGIKAKKFTIKGGKVEEPDMYLGAELSKIANEDGAECWAMSSEKYCIAAVNNVIDRLKTKGMNLPKRCVTPMKSGYRPELDSSRELNANDTQWYQEMIGQLRWACELGRVDILLEVSLMSQYLALPREGHLEQVIHIMGYLNEHKKLRLLFDAGRPHINEKWFKDYDWFDFYRDAEEELPPNMPSSRGLPVTINVFVDADHAGNKVTRRSQTGVLIFVNKSPIHWYSKKQPTVEASTFGSEFCAMKVALQMVQALRYKLRMLGVPIEGPANVFCDNNAVVQNTIVPESTLKKKHHSIAYHMCREAVAARIMRIAKQGTEKNLADLFTKILTAARRQFLLERFTY